MQTSLNRFLMTLVSALMTVLTVSAQTDYSRYYTNLPKAMPTVQEPSFPATTVSLKDYGGTGDGVTMNTEAFRKAISALSKQGGGHLVVPAGIYLTGLISLKDNIDLHLERNAVILFSPDKRDLIKVGDDGKPEQRAAPCITASKRTNIAITGDGIIDGNGKWWRAVKRVKVSDVEWKAFLEMGGTVTEKGDLWYPFNLKHEPDVAATAEAQEKVRNHLIRLTDCRNVLVRGVTLRNSPRFHLVPSRCENVIIDGITVKCPWNAQNGDAIDIGNCRNVLVVNNTIDCGDDGICMKGGAGQKGANDGPCLNINIQDNIVFHAHGGFVIGSEFSGGMENIFVHNNTFSGTDTGLRFKSSIGRGGTTKDIFISGIYMTDIKDQAIVFECDYFDNHVGAKAGKKPTGTDFAPNFTDIHITDVVCRGAKTAIKAGGAEGMVHGIDITNSTFFADNSQDIAPTCDVRLTNVTFKSYGE